MSWSMSQGLPAAPLGNQGKQFSGFAHPGKLASRNCLLSELHSCPRLISILTVKTILFLPVHSAAVAPPDNGKPTRKRLRPTKPLIRGGISTSTPHSKTKRKQALASYNGSWDSPSSNPPPQLACFINKCGDSHGGKEWGKASAAGPEPGQFAKINKKHVTRSRSLAGASLAASGTLALLPPAERDEGQW